MALQIQGNGGVVAEVDGTTYRAVRTTLRPTEYGAYGHYRTSMVVPLVATQAANGTLFSFRWGDATRLCAIQDIRLQVLQTVAATATIMPNFSIFVARAFTVSDSVGTVATLTGNSFKKRTSMGTTLLTDMRASAVAAGLTVGTRTLDSQPIAVLPTQQTITTPNSAIYTVDLDFDQGVAHPLIFAQNEGFIVQGPSIIFGAAGTANLIVDVAWSELAVY